MKKIVLIVIMLTMPWYGYGQSKYPLVLSSVQVKLNGEFMTQSEQIEEELVEDVAREIEIFNDNGVRFVVSFEFARSGKRVKLVRRSYAQENGDKPVHGKIRKDMHYIKVAIPGSFEGKHSESLLLDKKNLESISVSYRYNFVYKS